MENVELRLYTFGNFYLSSIQQGIQAGHAAVEMATKYGLDCINPAHRIFYNWATEDKTMICKNGGDEESLRELSLMLESPQNYLPWSQFTETQSALNGALTCVAIVVPATLYNLGVRVLNNKDFRHVPTENGEVRTFLNVKAGETYEYTVFEVNLIKRISESRNAI